MFGSLLLSLAVATSQAPAAPKIIEVPPAEKAKPQEYTVRIGELKRLKFADEKARWELEAGTLGADIVTDGKGGVAFVAEDPGAYCLICYTDGPATWVKITVPKKTPDPNPHVPPAPVVNPTAESIRAAFKDDAGTVAAKKTDAAALSGFWEAGVGFCDNATVTTAGDLIAQIRKVGDKTLPADRLTKTRKAIGDATLKLFGKPEAELTKEMRASAKELFTIFANTLEELSK